VAPKRAPKRWVRLLETVRLLHRLLDKTLCEEAFRAVRSSERERKLSLFLLVRFWVAVLVRAPESLTQLLQEARKGGGVLVPALEATEEAFFQRCRDLSSKFFAELYRRFLARVLPEALPDYEGELGGLRSRFSAVCVIDGSRLDAVAHRLKILRDVRAPVLGGCVTAVYDLFRGITQGLFYYADAAVGEMRRVMEVLDAIPRGALTVNDRAYGNGKYFDALEERGLFGLVRRSRAWSLRTLEELGRIQRGGLVLVESVVEAGREEGAEPRVLRRFEVYRGRKRVLDLVTDVLDRRRLPMHQAIRLYGRRWTVGASREGRMTQSVKVRPRPEDSGLRSLGGAVARKQYGEALRQHISKGGGQRSRLQREANAGVASSHANPVAETVYNARRQQGPMGSESEPSVLTGGVSAATWSEGSCGNWRSPRGPAKKPRRKGPAYNREWEVAGTAPG